MDEEKIAELLVGELGKTTPVRFQKKLLDRILAAGKKKYGAISDRALKPEAIRYFLARGVIDYEESQIKKNMPSMPKPKETRPSLGRSSV